MGLVNEFGVGSLLKGFLASKFFWGWRIAKTEMHNCSMITEGYTVILFLIFLSWSGYHDNSKKNIHQPLQEINYIMCCPKLEEKYYAVYYLQHGCCLSYDSQINNLRSTQTLSFSHRSTEFVLRQRLYDGLGSSPCVTASVAERRAVMVGPYVGSTRSCSCSFLDDQLQDLPT